MDAAAYLRENDDFYTDFFRGARRFSTVWPNTDEVARLGVLFGFLARIRLRAFQAGVPRILDVGCGRGWLTTCLSLYGACTGIDPSSGAIRRAQELFPTGDFRASTIDEHLKEPGFTPYDIVVCSEVIEHVPYQYKRDFVANLTAAVKPQGHCLITTPRGEKYKAYARNPAAVFQPVEDWLTENQVKQFFAKQGFRVSAYDRAYSLPLARGERLLAKGRRLMPGPLRRAYEYVSSLYQIWWFERN